MKQSPLLFLLTTTGAALTLVGCSHNNPPVAMAPPTNPVTISQPMQDPNGQMANGQMAGGQMASQNGAYNWTEVPVNQQVPITRAVFDQGGYQLYSPQGTIVVPFANQNMYVMKFGQSQTGQTYFVNSGSFPTLFIPPGAGLQNAAQQGALWYPFPQNYNYTSPVYVGLAPSWSAFSGMGWYPGMSYYGGYYGYSPYSIVGPMVGLHFLIGGSPYYGWNSYHSYYNSHPGYAPMRVVNRTVYNQAARSSSFGSSRAFGSGGGFGSSGGGGRRTFGSAGSTFGGGRSSFGGSRPATGSSGSFGRGPSGFGGSFGAGRRSFPASAPSSPSPSGGSFGSRPSFGGGGSFGGGSSSPRPSFGGGSSSGSFGGSSFGGGGRSSFGGGSFGGGGRSFGGGGRRR